MAKTKSKASPVLKLAEQITEDAKTKATRLAVLDAHLTAIDTDAAKLDAQEAALAADEKKLAERREQMKNRREEIVTRKAGIESEVEEISGVAAKPKKPAKKSGGKKKAASNKSGDPLWVHIVKAMKSSTKDNPADIKDISAACVKSGGISPTKADETGKIRVGQMLRTLIEEGNAKKASRGKYYATADGKKLV